MPTCSAHRRRLPPPIRSRERAVAALRLATDDGRDDVVALACLDRARRPLTMFVVEGCAATVDDVLVALGVLLDAIEGAATPLDAVILAASRPGGPAGATPDDVRGWTVFRNRCIEAGVELLEFFVLADGVVDAVGERLGEAARW
jgi:hypothetical protein